MDVIGKFENALKVMTESENSQFMIESTKRHIKLAPKYIGNLRVGVARHLSKLLSCPGKMSDGFLVAYSNVKVQQALGKMVSDQPCIHFDIIADFIMFQPTVGCTLIGKVNKVAKRHIGCLVHDHFNAWMPHTKVTETHAVDTLIGSEMEFTVKEISTNRNVLSIKGRFEKFVSFSIDNAITMHPLEKPPTEKKKKKKKNKIGDADKQVEKNEEIVADTTKKKEKHKKYVAETAEEQYTDSQVEGILSDNHVHEESNADSMRKKRKKDKKKKSHKEKETVNEEIGDNSVNDSIVSLTSCEPLLTSSQRDENNSSVSQLHSFTNGGTGLIVEDVSNDSEHSVKNNRLTHSQKKQSKSRKRHHGDNETITLLSKDGLTTEIDMAVPSPIKKHKRHKEKNQKH